MMQIPYLVILLQLRIIAELVQNFVSCLMSMLVTDAPQMHCQTHRQTIIRECYPALDHCPGILGYISEISSVTILVILVTYYPVSKQSKRGDT